MADEREEDQENVIDSAEASIGRPSRHDPTGTRLRAETPGMLSPDDLDRRQKQLRTTRRHGGPDVSKAPSRRGARADDEAEDVPPTETEPPPGPPPPPVP